MAAQLSVCVCVCALYSWCNICVLMYRIRCLRMLFISLPHFAPTNIYSICIIIIFLHFKFFVIVACFSFFLFADLFYDQFFMLLFCLFWYDKISVCVCACVCVCSFPIHKDNREASNLIPKMLSLIFFSLICLISISSNSSIPLFYDDGNINSARASLTDRIYSPQCRRLLLYQDFIELTEFLEGIAYY